MVDHEHQSRCMAGDCDGIPEEDEDFCAFHDELYGRDEQQGARAWVPLVEENGHARYDGFSQIIELSSLSVATSMTLRQNITKIATLTPGEQEREIRRVVQAERRRSFRRRLFSGIVAAPRVWSGVLFFNPVTYALIPQEWVLSGWRGTFMRGKSGQLERLGHALASGLGIRAAARDVGCSRGTARRLHRVLLTERNRNGLGDFLCPCGQPSTHPGWCVPRYLQSEKRQGALAELHARQSRKQHLAA